MVDPVTIGNSSCRWLFDSNTQYITLFNDSDFGTKSLHNTSNVDYQVPAGRKFIILSMWFNGTEQTLYYDTSADTAGTKIFHNDGQGSVQCHTWIEIPAGNYVTVTVSGSNTQGIYSGIETTT